MKDTFDTYNVQFLEPIRYACETNPEEVKKSISRSINKALKYLYAIIDKNKDIEQKIKLTEIYPNLVQNLNKNIFFLLKNEITKNKQYEDLINKIINESIKSIKSIEGIKNGYIDFLKRQLERSMLDEVTHPAVENSFHRHKREEGVLNHIEPNRSINNALEWLNEKGIFQSDLHEENIMIRPETGQIVFSDVGNFYY
jgi:hypothetical protein